MVDPVHVEEMLQVLRRNGVAAFKCEQYELVLEKAMPEPSMNPEVETPERGVEEMDMLFSHLNVRPNIPEKPRK